MPIIKINNKVNKYKAKIRELKEKEEGLKTELVGTKARLERAEDEVNHWRRQSATPTFNFLSGNQSNLSLVMGDNANQTSQTYKVYYNDQQLQKELSEFKEKYILCIRILRINFYLCRQRHLCCGPIKIQSIP